MVKIHYIYGESNYYVYGYKMYYIDFLKVSHLLRLWLIFIAFMMSITFMVVITFMDDTGRPQKHSVGKKG